MPQPVAFGSSPGFGCCTIDRGSSSVILGSSTKALSARTEPKAAPTSSVDQQKLAASLSNLAENSQKNALLLQELRELMKPGAARTPEPSPQLAAHEVTKLNSVDTCVEVHLYSEVQRVFNLDTVTQTFGVQLSVKMMWEMPAAEPFPLEQDLDHWVPMWAPRYRIRRKMEEQAVETDYHLLEVGGQMWIKMERIHLVRIFDRLELYSFPVDCQNIHVELLSEASVKRVKWLPMTLDEAFVALAEDQCFLDDFHLAKVPFTYVLHILHRQHVDVSCLLIKLKVVRKPLYYVINVLMVMQLICTFAFCAWGTHPGDISARFAVDFSLLLTAVAFKLILVSMLPKVSYATKLDIYIMVGFFHLACVTLCHTLLPWRYIEMADHSPLTLPPDFHSFQTELIEADSWAMWIFAVLWLCWNSVYIAWLTCYKITQTRFFVSEALKEQLVFDGAHRSLVPSRFLRSDDINAE